MLHNVGFTCKGAWRTAGSASGVPGGLVRCKPLLVDHQIVSASYNSEKAVASHRSERAGTMLFENEPFKADCTIYPQQFCMPGGHAHGNEFQPYFCRSKTFAVLEPGRSKKLEILGGAVIPKSRKGRASLVLTLSTNVGLTCKVGWRGPCVSTVRDKRLCQVQALVIWHPDSI
jgi:hypothetical protein